MKITLDYEEYLELKEKADLNKKKIQKIRDEYSKKLIDEIPGIRKQLRLQYEGHYKLKFSESIGKIRKLSINNSLFGYISLSKLYDVLDKVISYETN